VSRGGVPVRNVAQPVIKHAYYVYSFNGKSELAATARSAGKPRYSRGGARRLDDRLRNA
jgi:hypothetical protein